MRVTALLLILAMLALSSCGFSYHDTSTPQTPGYDVSHYRPNTDPEYPAQYRPGFADTQAPIRYDDEMNYNETEVRMSFNPLPW